MADERNSHHDGPVAARISQSAVKVILDYTGRGPTKVRTTINSELVVIVLRDGLLKAEKSLVAAGQGQTVLDLRRKFQEAMRDDLVEIVEENLGRRVVAFMSENHVDPDLAAEVFILEPEDAASPAA
jgi:uncharacterized protein YbcI